MNVNFKQCHSSNYSAGRKKPIEFIVVHYTGNNGDTAKNNADYFANNKNIGASAHYFVYRDSVWQSVKDTDTAWHCGAKTYYNNCRNANSIGVELCSKKSASGYYFEPDTVYTAVDLIKQLMNKYNIGVDNVVRHFDVTHKNCPAPFVDNPVAWTSFKNLLKGGSSMTQYNDVPSGYWAEEKIKRVTDAGIMCGYSDGSFKPTGTLTRAELACVIANTLKYLGK